METNNTENSGLSEAQDRVLRHWESANQYYKEFNKMRIKTLEEVWKCGQALREVREKLPRGQRGKWLESVDIPTSTAYRWMKFSKLEFSKIPEPPSVNQGLKALQVPRSERKEPAKEVKPEVETQGEASSVRQEEASEGDRTPQPPDSNESEWEIQDLQEKLRKANEKIAELSEANKETEGLRQENDELKRLLKEHRIPWESTPVVGKRIYPNSAISGKSENPESGGARTTAAPGSGETPTHQHPETRTPIPVNAGK